MRYEIVATKDGLEIRQPAHSRKQALSFRNQLTAKGYLAMLTVVAS